MKVTEARSVLLNQRASVVKKQMAKKVVRVADLKNLLARANSRLIGLRFNTNSTELTAEAKKARDFKFWAKSEGVKPFAKGSIPVEAETAPGLSRMYQSMTKGYENGEGRQVFYAQVRKIVPTSKLMRHVFSTLKKIVEAKQKERTGQLRAWRAHLNQLRRLVESFEDFRDQKQYARAALELRKIDLLI